MKHDYTINGDSALYSTLDEIQRLYKENGYLSVTVEHCDPINRPGIRSEDEARRLALHYLRREPKS